MNMGTFLKNFLTYSVAIFLVVFAALFFVILPLHQKIGAEGDEIQKILAKTENSERKISRLPEFESQYETIRGGENRIRLLLSEDRAVDFIREIETLAEGTDGDVTIAQGASSESAKKKAVPAKEKDGDDAPAKDEPKTIGESLPWEKSLRLRVRFTGTYQDAVNFLHKIETMPYRLDVIVVDIRPVPDEEKRRVGVIEIPVVPASEPGSEQVPAAVPPAPAPVEFPVDASFEVAVYLQ